VANEARLGALGAAIDEGARTRPPRRKASKRVRRNRIIAGGLAFILLVVGTVLGYGYYLTQGFNREQVKGLASTLTVGSEAGSQNILMVGSTSRCALAVQNPAYGLCSQGVNGVNSDVIMILHTDPTHHRLALLSIPRDTFIPNARSTGANKIDAGLYEGAGQLVAAIEEDLAIPIQHAVSVNFDQFANIVDSLGGIDMSFPMSVFDAESGLNVQAAPCVHLNGTQALQVVRARHLQYDASGSGSFAPNWPKENLSDLARIRRDHEFLRVLASSVSKRGLSDPITDVSLINSVKADLTFDQSWSVSEMASLVLGFHSVSINKIPQLTLPVSVVNDPNGPGGSYQYKGGSYGDVEFPVQAIDQKTIDTVLGITSGTNSMTGEPLPKPSAVTVSVMNGTGVTNQATTTQASLTALGFKVVALGDVAPVADISETVVNYGSRSPKIVAAAQTVARSIAGNVILAYDPAAVTHGAEVTVVTGTQFAVNSPASAAPPAKAKGVTTTTAPTAAAAGTSSAIMAPSSPSQTLEPWDPRACAPGASATAPVPNQT
jgi:LCP family protein required for cell wall assembly